MYLVGTGSTLDPLQSLPQWTTVPDGLQHLYRWLLSVSCLTFRITYLVITGCGVLCSWRTMVPVPIPVKLLQLPTICVAGASRSCNTQPCPVCAHFLLPYKIYKLNFLLSARSCLFSVSSCRYILSTIW